MFALAGDVTCFRVCLPVCLLQVQLGSLLVSGSSPRSTASSRSTRQQCLATIARQQCLATIARQQLALTMTVVMTLTVFDTASCDKSGFDVESRFCLLFVVCFVLLQYTTLCCSEQFSVTIDNSMLLLYAVLGVFACAIFTRMKFL